MPARSKGGLSPVLSWESSYYGGSGAGQHTETVVVAPPYENVGAGVSIQSKQRTQGYLPMAQCAFSDAVGSTLRSALMRVSLKEFQLGIGLAHPAPVVMYEQRRYPY